MNFKELSSTAKVWVYQSNRSFNQQELQRIEEILTDFISKWDSHGNQLKASFEIRNALFIIIAVDQTYGMASGCSIDKSVAVIKEIEKEFNISLLDRSLIAYQNNNVISSVKFTDIRKMISEGNIKPETIIFNNLVGNVEELNSRWELPAAESWLSKFFDN